MFSNKTIWVTGASSGIGKALSIELAKMGATLVLSARNQQALSELKNSLTNSEKHHIFAFDVGAYQHHQTYVEKVWQFTKGVDVLINCAGLSMRGAVVNTKLEVDESLMAVNYFGPLALTKALVPHWQARSRGMVINLVSMAGQMGSPLRAAYAASKHALLGYMDCLRSEVFKDGIKVINVNPSFVKTKIAINAVNGDATKYGKTDHEIEEGMDANLCAKLIIKKVLKGKEEINIAKGKVKWGFRLYRINANWYHKAIRKFYSRKI